MNTGDSITVRRYSALGLVLAAAGFALYVLPSLYPLPGAAQVALALCCIVLGLIVNVATLVAARGEQSLLAGIGLGVGACSLLWILAGLYGLGTKGILIFVLVLLFDAGIGFWCMTVFRRKGRSAAGGFALGFVFTFFLTLVGAILAMSIAYLSRPVAGDAKERAM